ncbi:MAG: copper chaperone PCu(A)C [Sphingomonas sp.]|uniref:copper chaperone PCu(A)C n=1 Tax=Sphingomonas sp. TaxID=28214 RepID=UPI0017AFC3B0|nr:copper chaperone PCu(A)C [Sphingomonas sp.]MBA3666954.1 copper chaperone PCu(A)C [Sphingomonas sp.]
MRYLANLLPLLMITGCGSPAAPEVMVTEVWARAVAPGQTTGAVYMTIANKGDDGDRLLAAKASVAPSAMLHRSTTTNGIVSMEMVKSLDIPAHGKAVLAPGGTHLMMTGLTVPLSPGDRFFVDFTFERSGHQTASGKVAVAGAR